MGLMTDYNICDSCVYDAKRYDVAWGSIPTLHSVSALRSLYEEHNLSAWPPELVDVPNIVDSNKGGTTRLLWKNQFHADELRDVATLENATKVAWEYLFSPTAATLAAMRPFEHELDNASLVIAIHARTGDKSLGQVPDPNRDFGSFSQHVFFSCAAELTKRFANLTAGALRVRWFLSSDSLEFRRAAKLRFGDLLVTDTARITEHSGAGGVPDGNGHYKAPALVATVADMLLLAKGHFHVLSSSSGFGRIGALLSQASGAHIAWGADGARCADRLLTRLDSTFLGGWSGLRR